MFVSMLVSPGCDVNVLQQAGEAVGQRNTKRPQQVVPAGLHVLTGPALGVTLTTHIFMVRSHYVGDEVVVTTGCLENRRGWGGWFTKQTAFSQRNKRTLISVWALLYISDKHTCWVMLPGVECRERQAAETRGADER